MNTFFYIYIAFWSLACLIAATLYIRDNKSYALSHSRYWYFLFKPWKIVTFLIATSGMTVIAPYTGDPTWDYFDALFMSLLTYLTAPWAIGAIFKVIKKNCPLSKPLWLFAYGCSLQAGHMIFIFWSETVHIRLPGFLIFLHHRCFTFRQVCFGIWIGWREKESFFHLWVEIGQFLLLIMFFPKLSFLPYH